MTQPVSRQTPRRLAEMLPPAPVPPRPSRGRALLSAMRVHQWVKNLLVFVPVVLDHQVLNGPVVLRALGAFAAFSLAASGAYVLNDLLDLESDRQHETKRHRPFASGVLPPRLALVLSPLLVGGALLLAFGTLSRGFALMLAGYVAVTTAYSLRLKRYAVLDVLTLAGLYAWRVLAGVVATGVRFSTWLVAFSMFFFLSLAFLKRYGEVSRQTEDAPVVSRRDYARADREWLGMMGGSSGYLSVLVLALYISSDEVMLLYQRPTVLWLVCPVLLYWISRMWLLAYRGRVPEDPVVAAVRDPASYVAGAVVLAVLVAAS